jgi:hypothetical protein
MGGYGGAALHCMPLGRGRSRLLFTTFFKLPKLVAFIISLTPMWLRHLNSCKVLEQDVALITSQEDLLHKNPIDGTGSGVPADEWLVLNSADAFLVQYRKWLDHVGPRLPYYQGWRTRSAQSASATDVYQRTSDPAHRMHRSRYHNHVVHHKPTLRALQNIVKAKTALGVAGKLLTAASVTVHMYMRLAVQEATPSPLVGLTSALFSLAVAANKWCLPAFGAGLLALLSSSLLQRLEAEFHTNFKRHVVRA